MYISLILAASCEPLLKSRQMDLLINDWFMWRTDILAQNSTWQIWRCDNILWANNKIRWKWRYFYYPNCQLILTLETMFCEDNVKSDYTSSWCSELWLLDTASGDSSLESPMMPGSGSSTGTRLRLLNTTLMDASLGCLAVLGLDSGVQLGHSSLTKEPGVRVIWANRSCMMPLAKKGVLNRTSKILCQANHIPLHQPLHLPCTVQIYRVAETQYQLDNSATHRFPWPLWLCTGPKLIEPQLQA